MKTNNNIKEKTIGHLKIALDANGFDSGYEVVISAVKAFADENTDVWIYVYGPVKEMTELIGVTPKNVYFISATNEIEQSSKSLEFRRYRNSSLVRSLSALKNQNVDGLVSGNNSGCLLAASSMMILDKTKNNNRPFFCAILPVSNTSNRKRSVLFADCGANLFLTDQYYLQLSKTCISYFDHLTNEQQVEEWGNRNYNPRVGLLNVGREKGKGNEEMNYAYKILAKNAEINFIGNIEPTDVFKGMADIVICNGLIGNIFIKTVEASFTFLKDQLRQLFTSKIFLVGLGLLAKKKLQALKKQYESATVAYLLGLRKPVIKIHGSSSVRQIKLALNKICLMVIMDEQIKLGSRKHSLTTSSGNTNNSGDSDYSRVTKKQECFTSETLLNKKLPHLKHQDGRKVLLTAAHKQILAKKQESVLQLLKYLKIKPNDINLYIMAVTHVSWSIANNLPTAFNYERLEYSGDRAVNFFVSQYLDNKFPNISQGEITKMNSRIISNSNIANAARFIQIQKYANFGPQVKLEKVSTKILAAMFEAIIGAIQRDHKQSVECQKLIQSICSKLIIQTALREGVLQHDNNYKSQLQEYLSTKLSGVLIEYKTMKTENIRKQIYHTECLYVNGKKIMCQTGLKKNLCHQKIAKIILEKKKMISRNQTAKKSKS